MENKHEFTKNFLQPMLKRLSEEIEYVEYVKATPSLEEYVNVYFKNGYRKQVCVTCNSERAIALDVLKEIHI